jgi:mRNA interferase RelE/StbE
VGYHVRLTTAAERQFEKLPGAVQERLSPALAALSDTPFPADSQSLTGRRPYRRVRVGDYRIVYQVDQAAADVRVVALGHRKDIYRLLPKP